MTTSSTSSWLQPKQIIGWVIPGLVYISTVVLAYGDLRSNDRDHDRRLAVLEKQADERKADHDLLIRIDANTQRLTAELGALRAHLERIGKPAP